MKESGKTLPGWLIVALLLLVFVTMIMVVYWRLPVHVEWQPGVFSIGVDWKGTYRPAVQAFLHGKNPYDYNLQNPPWVILPLIPIALFPPALGAAVMFVTGFFVYAFIAYRLSLKWWAILLFLINPYTFCAFVNGNTDWLVALGFILPVPVGLFFLTIKPQLTIGLLIFRLIESLRKGVRHTILTFGPVTVAWIISFIVYGFWPNKLVGERLSDPYNMSLFPTVLPVGAALLFHAIRAGKPNAAISSSVFLTPYLSFHGYAIALLGLDSSLLAVAVVGIWLARFLI